MSNNFKEQVKKLLLDYKDVTHDEFGNWDPSFEAELVRLYSIHGTELITTLKDCIFELDHELGSMSMLFNHIFISDAFVNDSSTCKNMYDVMLYIFDNHKNKYVRMMALRVLQNSKYDSLESMEQRYENEKNMQVRNSMGGKILYKSFLKVGIRDYYGISDFVYKGDREWVNSIFEKIPKHKLVDELELINFLRDSKYISNQMRAYMESLSEKIGDENV